MRLTIRAKESQKHLRAALVVLLLTLALVWRQFRQTIIKQRSERQLAGQRTGREERGDRQ